RATRQQPREMQPRVEPEEDERAILLGAAAAEEDVEAALLAAVDGGEVPADGLLGGEVAAGQAAADRAGGEVHELARVMEAAHLERRPELLTRGPSRLGDREDAARALQGDAQSGLVEFLPSGVAVVGGGLDVDSLGDVRPQPGAERANRIDRPAQVRGEEDGAAEHGVEVERSRGGADEFLVGREDAGPQREDVVEDGLLQPRLEDPSAAASG